LVSGGKTKRKMNEKCVETGKKQEWGAAISGELRSVGKTAVNIKAGVGEERKKKCKEGGTPRLLLEGNNIGCRCDSKSGTTRVENIKRRQNSKSTAPIAEGGEYSKFGRDLAGGWEVAYQEFREAAGSGTG